MQNKFRIIVLVTVIFTGCLAAWQIQSGAGASVQAAAGNAGNSVGSNLPDESPAIQDALILQGWQMLRSLKEPVQVGNRLVVSGESLAQFLVESHIPVVWGSDEICGGSSCSRQYCTSDGICSFDDGQPGIDPIYLNPAIRSQAIGTMERLANELGHEIFHRMQPFGSGVITCLEEYWAFYVGAQLVGDAFPKFDGVDPSDPGQLERWFILHGLQGYLRLPAYPGGDAFGIPANKVGGALASD